MCVCFLRLNHIGSTMSLSLLKVSRKPQKKYSTLFLLLLSAYPNMSTKSSIHHALSLNYTQLPALIHLVSHANFAIDHFTSTVHKFQLANPPKCESLWEFSRFERPEALSSQKVSVILFPTNRTKGRPLPTLRLSVSEQRRTWCDQATYCIYRRSTCHGKTKRPKIFGRVEVDRASMKGVVWTGTLSLAPLMGRQWSLTASIRLHSFHFTGYSFYPTFSGYIHS